MTRDVSLDELADAAAVLADLREAARGALGRAWSVTRTRDLFDQPGPVFDATLWNTIRSLGWCDVLVDERAGGGGASIAELCVLVEEAGAVAAPAPIGTAAVAAWVERRNADGLPVTLAGGFGSADASIPTKVSGEWPVVAYGAVADRFVLAATSNDGTQSVVTVVADQRGVTREEVTPLDHGPAARVTFDDAPVAAVIATGAPAVALWDKARRLLTLTAVAELSGVAAAANDAACQYAKVRVAFDRPIGSYQAIKHRLVDQRAAIEVARALIVRAADACSHDSGDAEALTALAAFWAGDALRAVPEGAVQVFGGIAYTWEHEAHVFLRRAACLAASVGSRSTHRREVITWLTGR